MVSLGGINVAQIIRMMDWELTYSDIVLSLEGKDADDENDIVDRDLLNFLNIVTNESVHNFHDNVFLVFNKDRK